MSNKIEIDENIPLDLLNNKNIEYQELNEKTNIEYDIYMNNLIKKNRLLIIKDILVYTLPLIIFSYYIYYIYKTTENNNYLIIYIIFFIFVFIFIIRLLTKLSKNKLSNVLTNFKYSD